MTRTTLAAVTAALVATPLAVAQEAPALDAKVERIDTYLSRMATLDAFDGVILIAQGERVLLAEGYGFADRQAERPWTVDTVATIGSITKQFTGAAITLLAQEGRLDFDDTIGEFFPEAPADKAEITVHQLLTHAAGFPGAVGMDSESIGRDAYLARVWATPLEFEPGERYMYSNTGYSILAAIIEVVTNTAYERFVHERLFTPAGMTETGYAIPDWSDDELAVGYRGEERWGTIPERQTGGWSWNLMGNGGIHSTAGDMHRWWLALRSNAILDEAHTERYFAPHQDEGSGDSFYAYGWVNWTAPNGERLLSHNGGNGYLGADCVILPERDLFAVMLINDVSETQDLTRPVIEHLAGGELALPPTPEELDPAALAEAARMRAIAWIEALNAGPEAYVQYGFDHRSDRGEDEALNEQRREAAADLAGQFGRLEILRDSAAGLGSHRVMARATATGEMVIVTVRVGLAAPHLVERIGLDVRDGGG